MTAMIPIALRIDIIPAGMTLPVRRNFGTNCAASKSETIIAVANPIVRCSGNRNAATSNNTPVIEPAMIDATLPAFRYPTIPPTIVKAPKTIK